MIYDALIHRIHIVWIDIVALIDNDDINSTIADFILITDAITHGLWTSEYHQWLSFIGVQTSYIDATMTTLACVRLAILLNECAIKC